ncbi:hypothetical protein J4212_02160 [Candidatus Woesearchaeota archaeon]|nr:hypothetical protein [Candidatus Woesearchaeota archaeon]
MQEKKAKMHLYRKKAVSVLISLLVLFALVALYSFIQMQRGVAIFNLGMSYYAENMIVLVFSFLSIGKVVHEIYRIESHAELEERMKKRI